MEIKKQNNRNQKRKKNISIIFVVLFIIFLIPLVRTRITNVTHFIFMPIVRMSDSVGNSLYNLRETSRFKSSLVAENSALMQKIDQLNAQFANHDEVIRENSELKSIMGRSVDTKFVLAKVLSKPPVSLYDTLLIDGGLHAGLREYQTVYAYGYIPIGTIEKIFPDSALVKLYSSPGEKMDARLDPDHIDVTLFGRGGGNFLISLPHDFTLATGTTVVSKDLSSRVLAKLEKITSDSRDSSQSLLLSSPVNINNLSFVEVEQ